MFAAWTLGGLILLIVLIAALFATLPPPPVAARPFTLAGGYKGTITWFMHSYVPNVRAGAEITAHALNQKLLGMGWRVIVVLPDFQASDIDGVECIRYEAGSPEVDEAFGMADVIFCQNYDAHKAIFDLEHYHKPIVFFMHNEREKTEMLMQRFSMPIAVVYNSETQKVQNPTVHDATVFRPFIPYDAFAARGRDEQLGPVTLLNVNENKGGKLLVELARRMRDIPFVGVRGAYAEQVADYDVPNLTYKPTAIDPRPYYEAAGIYIMPSKNESWGRAALEAMSIGVPVIASTTHGIKEATGGACAAYCRVDDVMCWEENIRRLRGDIGFYRDAVQRGRERIARLASEDDFGPFEDWLRGMINKWKFSA
jgi:glycosyltransferase involved in cell wall biosynthesis